MQETACKLIRRFLSKRKAAEVRNALGKLRKINGVRNPLSSLVAHPVGEHLAVFECVFLRRIDQPQVRCELPQH